MINFFVFIEKDKGSFINNVDIYIRNIYIITNYKEGAHVIR